MCGIVGLFLKDRHLDSRLGELLASMLESLGDRGPDSAGFAIYGEGRADRVKISVHAARDRTSFEALATAAARALDCAISSDVRASHCVFSVPNEAFDAMIAWLAVHAPDAFVAGAGHRVEIFKDVGHPHDVAQRFELASMSGTHAVGHTRMATESAVSADGAHPFSTGLDQCLVHNGSLSNHNSVRRRLQHDGVRVDTDNDSEVAAAYLTWRMGQGMDLAAALAAAPRDLDGFYTFVVGTESGFGVLRDPIACKPAVMAETGAYVAFGSEYRALVELPGIDAARIWEPDPAKAYFWERAR